MFVTGASAGAEDWSDTAYESCIGRIADGDREALGALYEKAKGAVYGFALSIVQNAQEAEDIVQDTFISVYTSAQGYRRMGKPMAWVLTITRNLALMKVRDRKKTVDLPDEEWNLFKSDADMDSADDRRVLTAALRMISADESQIVTLHAVAGFKHREIASILEMPLSTVLSKYNRALKKLKSILEGDGVHAK